MTTSKKMEDDLKKNKNGRRPKRKEEEEKKEDDLKKLKTNQSNKINLIGCYTIVNSPSYSMVMDKYIHLKVLLSSAVHTLMCVLTAQVFLNIIIIWEN